MGALLLVICECQFSSNLKDAYPETSLSLSNLLDTVTSHEKTPVKLLVLDEANHYLNEANKAEARRIVDILSTITTTKRATNVVLCTNDFGFSSQLERIGIKTRNFTAQVVLSEPTADRALKTLTSEWKVGANLASALVDIYGGNLQSMSQKLRHLAYNQYKGVLFDTHQVERCLMECVVDAKLTASIVTVLKELARTGVVQAEHDDAL
eukprot:gene36020-44427_t